MNWAKYKSKIYFYKFWKMNEIKIINSLPPVTKFYCTIILVTSIIATQGPPLRDILYYIYLDYEYIFTSYQYWRLFTNIFFVGKISIHLFIFVFMVYINIKPVEEKYIILKSYAHFIMMILYLLIILNVLNIIAYIIFKTNYSYTLALQLIMSFIYIDSKRNPQKMVMLYIIRIKNCFLPYAMIVLNLINRSRIFDNIMGIIAGMIFHFIKDILTCKINMDILKTPKFLIDFFEKYYYHRLRENAENDDYDENENEVNHPHFY